MALFHAPWRARKLLVHGLLTVFTLGIWLLVPLALWTWRRGGASRRASYALWSLLAVVLVVAGASLGSGTSSTRETSNTSAPRTVAQSTRIAETPPAASQKSGAAETDATETAAETTTTTPKTREIAEVVDGDTVRLADGERVRLVQIDAPELRGGECYAADARETLRTLLKPGARVRLKTDPALDSVDQFGRTLVYVYKGRENVNHTLVLRGAASVWFYEGARGAHSKRLDAAAREARAAGRGLWGACPGTNYDPTRAVSTVEPAPAPPPPPPPPTDTSTESCHPSYQGACLDPTASDYDCEGGRGNGPLYTGFVRVVGPDEFGLDGNDDGEGCE